MMDDKVEKKTHDQTQNTADDDVGPWNVIVCAAPLSKELMDHFLEESGSHVPELVDDDWGFVFVDSMDTCPKVPAKVPTLRDSNPESPFIGKSPRECFLLLLELRETFQYIDHIAFIILDERSKQDDTALIVDFASTVLLSLEAGNMNQTTWPMACIRTNFWSAMQSAIHYTCFSRCVEDDLERAAKEKDGVFRDRGRSVDPSESESETSDDDSV